MIARIVRITGVAGGYNITAAWAVDREFVYIVGPMGGAEGDPWGPRGGPGGTLGGPLGTPGGTLELHRVPGPVLGPRER